jgi:phosphoribosylformylglycinamidine synthase
MWQFAKAIEGLASACTALDVPIVSGNVSLYNETEGRAILPTPTVAAVGIVRDPSHVVRSTFSSAGDAILLLGPAGAGPLGGSHYLVERAGAVVGEPPRVDLALEKKLQSLLRELASSQLLSSAHDVSDGGLAVTLVECAASHNDPRAMVGADVELPAGDSDIVALFGEAPSRVVVSTKPDRVDAVVAKASAAGVPLTKLGTTGGSSLTIRRAGHELARVDVGALRVARESCLDAIVGG